MKPTFNLSAAYVAPNVPAAIVRTAAMATTFHFFMILLRVGQTGVSSQFPLEKPPKKPPTKPHVRSARNVPAGQFSGPVRKQHQATPARRTRRCRASSKSTRERRPWQDRAAHSSFAGGYRGAVVVKQVREC